MKTTTKYEKQLVSWIYGRDESPMMYILRELIMAKEHGTEGAKIPTGSTVMYSSTRYTIHQDRDGYYYLSELLPVGTCKGRNADAETRDHCKHIADTLEAYATGTIFMCPHCGEEYEIPDDVGDKFRCPECGTVEEIGEFEPLSIWDYFGDVYDLEFRIDSSKEYRSVRIMVACGGPNIYIDTASGNVELYWWTDRARYAMTQETINAVNEWAEEYWGVCDGQT